MNVGERYTLAWRHPHRVDATIIALEADYIVADVDHRCPITCEMQQMRATLPMHGRFKYAYDDFAKLFVPLNPDAIALPA